MGPRIADNLFNGLPLNPGKHVEFGTFCTMIFFKMADLTSFEGGENLDPANNATLAAAVPLLDVRFENADIAVNGIAGKGDLGYFFFSRRCKSQNEE